MKNNFKVAVIGGGASGLFAVLELFKGNNALKEGDVLLLERTDRVGKKLIATGNGQGNLTNENLSKEKYFGDIGFVSAFIDNEKKVDIKKYLYSIGVPLISDSLGRVYPMSKQASAVLDTVRAIIENKVETVTNVFVKKITKKDCFEIKTDNKTYFADYVILAVGGKAQKQFGTDGSSYVLAQNLGHKITPLYPSLVQVKTDTEKIKALRGIREEVVLTVFENDKKIISTEGDLIFTDFGVSGNSVFKASSYITGKDGVSLTIDFLPNYSYEEVVKLLTDRKENASIIDDKQLLSCIVNKKVAETVYKFAKDKSISGLGKEVKCFKLKVNGTLGFDNAQVTRGGVVTEDVDKSTYMSKKTKGLYLVGEMLDVDGECGGYNLTFAFVTGICSARDIKNRIMGEK